MADEERKLWDRPAPGTPRPTREQIEARLAAALQREARIRAGRDGKN
jgi:hypothetical protein